MDDSRRIKIFGRRPPPAEPHSTAPDWRQAEPAYIERALRSSQSLPRSGWFVVDGVRQIRSTPRRYRLAGQEYVVWRDGEIYRCAPLACPHMGASLEGARVCSGEIVCPWHGLRLGSAGHGSWRLLPTFDDGVLLWVAPDAQHSAEPVLPRRPERFFDGVIRMEARCDPEDVIANRLDPWHGAHYHPYSFARLTVLEREEDRILVRVVYRVLGPYGVEVDALFDCADPYTVVMTIVAGEGVGSVVETHATPLGAGETAIIEATLATSDRSQFWALTGALSRVLRPLVESAAKRLWRDDAAYAERRHALRTAPRGGESTVHGHPGAMGKV